MSAAVAESCDEKRIDAARGERGTYALAVRGNAGEPMPGQPIGQRGHRCALIELREQILQLAPRKPIAADVDESCRRSADRQRPAIPADAARIFRVDKPLAVDLEEGRLTRC